VQRDTADVQRAPDDDAVHGRQGGGHDDRATFCEDRDFGADMAAEQRVDLFDHQPVARNTRQGGAQCVLRIAGRHRPRVQVGDEDTGVMWWRRDIEVERQLDRTTEERTGRLGRAGQIVGKHADRSLRRLPNHEDAFILGAACFAQRGLAISRFSHVSFIGKPRRTGRSPGR
jgi:hypothetical protein